LHFLLKKKQSNKTKKIILTKCILTAGHSFIFAGKVWSAEGSHVKIIAHTASTGEAFKETVYN
jgi:hypothetical protein